MILTTQPGGSPREIQGASWRSPTTSSDSKDEPIPDHKPSSPNDNDPAEPTDAEFHEFDEHEELEEEEDRPRDPYLDYISPKNPFD